MRGVCTKHLSPSDAKTSFYGFLMKQRKLGKTHFTLGIHVPGNKYLEEVTNSMDDLDSKLKIYLTEYTMELRCKDNPLIRVQRVTAYSRDDDMLGEIL
jgi:hypothetical protein